jgi:hypothetical protein
VSVTSRLAAIGSPCAKRQSWYRNREIEVDRKMCIGNEPRHYMPVTDGRQVQPGECSCFSNEFAACFGYELYPVIGGAPTAARSTLSTEAFFVDTFPSI